jgi:hypothetical protein
MTTDEELGAVGALHAEVQVEGGLGEVRGSVAAYFAKEIL